MYPNPVGQGSPIYLAVPAAQDFRITVLSVDGRVIHQRRISDHPGGRIELLTDGLSTTGVFLIAVKGGQLNFSERLLIQ